MKLWTAAQQNRLISTRNSFLARKISPKTHCHTISFTDLHDRIHFSVTIFKSRSDMVWLSAETTRRKNDSSVAGQ
jgi:hypothetical protein